MSLDTKEVKVTPHHTHSTRQPRTREGKCKLVFFLTLHDGVLLCIQCYLIEYSLLLQCNAGIASKILVKNLTIKLQTALQWTVLYFGNFPCLLSTCSCSTHRILHVSPLPRYPGCGPCRPPPCWRRRRWSVGVCRGRGVARLSCGSSSSQDCLRSCRDRFVVTPLLRHTSKPHYRRMSPPLDSSPRDQQI